MDSGTSSASLVGLSPLDFKAACASRGRAAVAAAIVGSVVRLASVAAGLTKLDSIETTVTPLLDLFGSPLPPKKLPPVPREKYPPGYAAWAKEVDRRFPGSDRMFNPITPVEDSHRHAFWSPRRAAVKAAYERLYFSAVKRHNFENCGSACYVQRSPSTGRLRLSADHCHQRFCLACGQARSRNIAQNLVKHINGKQTRFITLTRKHRAAPLKEQVNDLVKFARALRQTKLWKNCITGAAQFIEVKRSKDGQHWHPHIHIIAEGQFIPRDKLSAQWFLITGDSHVVDVQFARDAGHVANYVAKYASKPLDLTIFGEQDWLDEAIMSLHGRRLCTTLGTWRGVELEEKPVDPKDWVTVCSFGNLVEEHRKGTPWAVALWAEVTNTAVETADTTNHTADSTADHVLDTS